MNYSSTTTKTMFRNFTHSDHVLPTLTIPTPCPIHVEITDHFLTLKIGTRDLQWRLADAVLVGAGESNESTPPPAPFDDPMMYI
jgi:hypothetical protein